MGHFQFCIKQEEAEELVGIIAEYIDIDCTDCVPYHMKIFEYNRWVIENCTGIISCYTEEQYDKYFLVLLFQKSEDAVAFKLACI